MGPSFGAFVQHLPDFTPILLRAAIMTILVTIGGAIVATLIGLLVAGMKMQPRRSLRRIATVYIELARSTPMLTLLFIVYFGLPQFGLRLNPLPAAIIAFGIHGAAYVAEIFRAAIEAIDHGQSEAAFAIGMTRLSALRHIVMPQAARLALPPFCNYATQLLKDSSIASTVAVPELMLRARMLANETYLTSEIYLFVALIYLAMSLPLSFGVQHLQSRLGRGQLGP